MAEPKLPEKLEELSDLFAEIEGGWLTRLLARVCINHLGFARLQEKLQEVADAAVDDYFTGWMAEKTLEPKFRTMAKDFVTKTMEQLDRWAR